MAPSNKSRREHYVPRLYLDRFGTSLYGFDKKTGKTFPCTSKNIAFEVGFYDLHPSVDLEASIAENEANLNRGISELVNKRNPTSISDKARTRISLFIALQFVELRTIDP